ncbi:hypothetical protein Hanom_Chr04g00330861 [Helianthus anomalus]
MENAKWGRKVERGGSATAAAEDGGGLAVMEGWGGCMAAIVECLCLGLVFGSIICFSGYYYYTRI